jgi:hypothetical protein
VPFEEINKDILPEYCPMKTSEEAIKSVIEKYRQDDVKRIYIPPLSRRKKHTNQLEACAWPYVPESKS